jgi:hypothetical protein
MNVKWFMEGTNGNKFTVQMNNYRMTYQMKQMNVQKVVYS